MMYLNYEVLATDILFNSIFILWMTQNVLDMHRYCKKSTANNK